MSDVQTPQFAGAYFLNNIDICDRLIHYHSDRRENVKSLFDPNVKDSVDVPLDKSDPLMAEYYIQLMGVVGKYLEEYPEAGGNSRWAITESIGIQWYPIGGGFKAWHTERHSGYGRIGARHLVFMTYLNDVEDGGTEFKHQNWISPAIKGLTLIWPTDWTFTHRGQVSHTKEKYVTTGWFSHTS
jgi:hypothetical protein